MKNGKLKLSMFILIALSLVVFITLTTMICGVTEKSSLVAEASEFGTNQDSSTRGIYTALSISINGGNGKVWTTVKNDVTIFPSTVVVIVELYSSETFTESYTNMKLEQKVQIGDLNLGKTITAEAPTNGVKRYWQGRTRYKVDNGQWKEMRTGICIYDGNGNFISFA